MKKNVGFERDKEKRIKTFSMKRKSREYNNNINK